MRESGILMPVSSLPGPYGIGCFGKEAFKFVDFLAQAGQKIWQILPLSPTGYGDSPYQSCSAFAGNPYFIDLDALKEEGLLTAAQLKAEKWGTDPKEVDYGTLYVSRFKVLRTAYAAWRKQCAGLHGCSYYFPDDYYAFTLANEEWLDDYALYMALKVANGMKNWVEWDKPYRLRDKKALAAFAAENEEEIGFWKFVQYKFAAQWQAVKAYANKKDVQILGDIPIYVSADSVEAGVGGALFSPSIEALLAKAGTYSEAKGKRSRAEWFALFAVCGELGAVLGPVAGALLTGLGFRQVALAGAGVFLVALVVLYFCLPASRHAARTLKLVPWWTTFRQPRFVAFIIAYSSWLLSYNQLYLALPVEIQRAGGNEKDLGPLFMLASVLIVALQLPLARFARRVGAVRILPVGFLFLSAAFASVAMFAPTAPPEGWLRLLPSVCFVTLLTLGQMLLVPSAKDLVPRFAEESTLGAHYGALATAGGIAVLAGNLLFGSLLDRALVPSTQAMLPWLLLALFPLCSALALNVICRPLRS